MNSKPQHKPQPRKLLVLLLAFVLAFSSMLPAYGATSASSKTKANKNSKQAVRIVYTNDIHGYIANDTSNGGLRLSNISQKVKDMRKAGKNVVLVDVGDAVHGSSFASMDDGESIINLMNATGYQLSAVGNHEFDYGMDRFFELADKAKFKYISCNFRNLLSGKRCFAAYKIYKFGKTKVAFIGISTPSITNSTPKFFQNEKGEWIYGFDGTADAKDFYKSIQTTVNAARKKADYVIAIGHTGSGKEEIENGVDVRSIVKNTSGIDVFLSGHSHNSFEQWGKNKKGKKVLVTQAGSYLSSFGVIRITKKGEISNKFYTKYDKSNAKVAALEDELVAKVNGSLGQKIATLDTTLTITDPDTNIRRIRSNGTNGGDFANDAIYWYLNDKKGIDCDLTILNGGSIRTDIKAGDVTKGNLKDVQPFGNVICLVSASGQQIKDALELGANQIGKWNNDTNAPAEFGGFFQVSGVKFSIDSSIESSVKLDENGMFVSVDGDYKVHDIEIYNRETSEYEPIDLNKKYRLASISYILRNNGNGMTMFQECELLLDYIAEDYETEAEYAMSFAKDGEYPRINTANSPLASLKGYLIDYENPHGSGRITVE